MSETHTDRNEEGKSADSDAWRIVGQAVKRGEYGKGWQVFSEKYPCFLSTGPDKKTDWQAGWQVVARRIGNDASRPGAELLVRKMNSENPVVLNVSGDNIFIPESLPPPANTVQGMTQKVRGPMQQTLARSKNIKIRDEYRNSFIESVLRPGADIPVFGSSNEIRMQSFIEKCSHGEYYDSIFKIREGELVYKYFGSNKIHKMTNGDIDQLLQLWDVPKEREREVIQELRWRIHNVKRLYEMAKRLTESWMEKNGGQSYEMSSSEIRKTLQPQIKKVERPFMASAAASYGLRKKSDANSPKKIERSHHERVQGAEGYFEPSTWTLKHKTEENKRYRAFTIMEETNRNKGKVRKVSASNPAQIALSEHFASSNRTDQQKGVMLKTMEGSPAFIPFMMSYLETCEGDEVEKPYFVRAIQKLLEVTDKEDKKIVLQFIADRKWRFMRVPQIPDILDHFFSTWDPLFLNIGTEILDWLIRFGPYHYKNLEQLSKLVVQLTEMKSKDWFADKVFDVFAKFMRKNDLDPKDCLNVWMQGSQRQKIRYVASNMRTIQLINTKDDKCAKALRETGIRHFARYPEEMLQHVYENLNNRNLRYGVIATPVKDSNHAFSANKGAYKNLYQDLIKLGMGVRIIEGETLMDKGRQFMKMHKKYYEQGRRTSEKNKMSFLIATGHGNTELIENFLTKSDLDGKGTQRSKQFFGDYTGDFTCILNSCNTGMEGAISEKIFEKTGWNVIAPKVPVSVKNFHVEQDKKGRLKWTVEYLGYKSGGSLPDGPTEPRVLTPKKNYRQGSPYGRLAS